MKHIVEEARGACSRLIRFFNDCKWDEAQPLFSDDFEAWYPQSRERIVGSEKFIEANRRYPGERTIYFQNSIAEYDVWDKEAKVSIQARADTLISGSMDRTYLFWFIDFDRDGYIKAVTEYLASTCIPPGWRKDLVEH